MISRLRGTLLAKQAPIVLIEVGGEKIGGLAYEVFMPLNNFYRLPPLGEEVVLYTHFIVRENEQLLYGFLEEKQRVLFRALIRVNGVGPKLALTILSGVEPDILVHNVLNGDVSNLVKLPGIGEKTAQRLVMEMRDKVEDMREDPLQQFDSAANTTVRDAVSALIALGYKPQEAQRAVSKHKDKQLPSEEIIRLALREM